MVNIINKKIGNNILKQTRLNEPSKKANDCILNYDKRDVSNTIKNNMGDILAMKNNGDLYHFLSSEIVFTLKQFPGVIFKTTSKPAESKDYCNLRMNKFNLAKKVCDEAHLDLLVLPDTETFPINHKGKNIHFIAEKKLDVTFFYPRNCSEDPYDVTSGVTALLDMENVLLTLKDRTKEAVEQLTTFIFKTKCSDVNLRNFPILKEGLKNENSLKIGLVDVEHCGEEIDLEDVVTPLIESTPYVHVEHFPIIKRVLQKHIPIKKAVKKMAYACENRTRQIDNKNALARFYKKNQVETGLESLSKEKLSTCTGKDIDNIIESKYDYLKEDVDNSIYTKKIELLAKKVNKFAPKYIELLNRIIAKRTNYRSKEARRLITVIEQGMCINDSSDKKLLQKLGKQYRFSNTLAYINLWNIISDFLEENRLIFSHKVVRGSLWQIQA